MKGREVCEASARQQSAALAVVEQEMRRSHARGVGSERAKATKMTNRAFSNELQLLLACCRWPPEPEAVRAAADTGVDWIIFLDLLRRHGVVALASHAIWKANVETSAAHVSVFRKSVELQVQHSLNMARETARLAQSFAEAGITCRFFKGPTLARLAYSDFGLKRSADIDVLIAPAALERACDRLRGAGFIPAMIRNLDPASFDRYLRLAKEVAFVDSQGIVVELHLRISDNKEMLQTMNADSEPQHVSIGSVSVPTFNDRLLYPYLCYHGAVHGWSRLKWLVDLNAFLEGRDVAMLHESAVAQGVESASLVALSLCQSLLGRDLAVTPQLSLLQRVQRRISLAAIQHPLGGSEVTSVPMATALRICGATIGGNFSSAKASLIGAWSQPQLRARYADGHGWRFHLFRIPIFLWALPRRLRAVSVDRST
ncbi:nucleotidyltransferase family protein [Sphingomonas sp. SUN039]|uniref:nucleotidyltransferase domain-containing protein n=1 Tax=Sphingomonas sp. SUN039 TaxID=2937787 RepID=UPI002164DD67|nr:nucleotidyltransferase family protein [Sphingomonas sp. SUN039]UVO52819.1 nucleotidyltransferase family protein [Sphingomonas sp. SUN039]